MDAFLLSRYTKNRAYLLLSFSFLLFSCNKQEAVPVQRGFLEDFIKSDGAIKVYKTTNFPNDYRHTATYRGYIFKPLEAIKITAIGGKIAAEGTYRIELYDHTNLSWTKSDPLLVDSVAVSNTDGFQYKPLAKALELKANHLYLIRYFNKSHDSVYDALLPESYNPDQGLYFPFQIKEIEVMDIYYTYHYLYEGQYYWGEEGTYNTPKFRGLVDFTYEKVR
ncbi:hypothetical protein Q0590_35940 [Rhodocytophaga aerolata]|uniref:DUF4377 domain-containing protein n=1 Tax=Rhodocytophaga aerolata TaxID=455078 RepID=A0ABT8RJ07_9BACT|nr:hypothetical protein [Rhodocytophaga aerolata]MDO1451721.1 hypothetical protein [Rhodocytophaga aerolata]